MGGSVLLMDTTTKECSRVIKEMATECKVGLLQVRKLDSKCIGANLRLECDMVKELSNNGNKIAPLESFKVVDTRENRYTGHGKMITVFKLKGFQI